MKQSRILIAAPKSGSGKTVLTIALLQALLQKNKTVSAFKCGPDYIDPMFHTKVIGVPSRNLDLFFENEQQLRDTFLSNSRSQISVIEGVMGLYDGIGGIHDEGSSYHVAKVLKTPVILVVNAHGMGRSVLAEIRGFLDMDEEHLIKGVILNCISGMFYQTLRPLIEDTLSIPVLGYYEERKDMKLESRHLGLKLPEEIQAIREMVHLAGERFLQTVDTDRLLEIAETAPELEEADLPIPRHRYPVRIGVARDEAFCFYYEENLRFLQNYGAELVYFSPLHDRKLPSGIDGLLLGGGYPELKAKELEDNLSMRNSIKEALEGGMPSLAECGGFMYLLQEMETEEGQFKMTGVLKGRCFNTGRLVRFGYVEITGKDRPLSCKGHEFHYYDSTDNGSDCVAQKPLSVRNWECAHVGENHWWGYAHLYYKSSIKFTEWFLEQCLEYREG